MAYNKQTQYYPRASDSGKGKRTEKAVHPKASLNGLTLHLHGASIWAGTDSDTPRSSGSAPAGIKNPLKWILDEVQAGRIDFYIALLFVVGLPLLIVMLANEVWQIFTG